MTQTAIIASLNDLCRTAPGLGGRWVCTPGFAALDDATKSALRERVETYDRWTLDNDPWGEHDFGIVQHEDIRVFWKIDYYDLALEQHSPDATNPACTTRVLTLMLAQEY